MHFCFSDVTEWINTAVRSIKFPEVSTAADASYPSNEPPPAKSRKMTSSLFASYRHRNATADQASSSTSSQSVSTIVSNYMTFVQTVTDGKLNGIPWKLVKAQAKFERIMPLLESIFCSPCTSAPVERVFSHGGIFIRPHRARMSDKVLCELMLAKCNALF